MTAHPEQIDSRAPLFRKSQQIKGARAAILSLVASLLVVAAPMATPAMASIDNLNFNDQDCDLSVAGYLGTGAASDPYQISDSDSLWEVTDCSVTNSAPAHFELTNDIDVSQAVKAPTSSPIGMTNPAPHFRGILDGGNKVISGISMSATSSAVGLFFYLWDATISNVVISGSFATSTTNTNHAAGALATRAAGLLHLSSISNQASVTGNHYVGGLVGSVAFGWDAYIINSRNHGSVVGSDYVGGLVGGVVLQGLNISNSENSGAVSGAGLFVGGLVGESDADANINNSHNSGPISGSDYVGGLVGYVVDDANITSSYNTGPISGSDYVGGLLGYVVDDANITSSYNTGPISGSDYVGGLVGNVDLGSANIASSHNSGPISGSGNVGGLAGYVKLDANITSSHNSGAVSGSDYHVGGLLGQVDLDANITSSHNSGAVSGLSHKVGGLVGNVESGSVNINFSRNTGSVAGEKFVGGVVGNVDFGSANITSTYNSGSISGLDDNVGGLAGYVVVNANITSSYNSGAVSGLKDVGGLIGDLVENANINSSYNTGPISGSRGVGGLVGDLLENANITSSYNTGAVSGLQDVGGLAGDVGGDANIISSFNTGAVSGTTNVDGLAGTVSGTLTTTSAYTSVTSDYAATSTVADMKKASTFTGFDFTSSNPVWGFGSCTDNQGFPMLRVFAEISNYNSVACGYTPPAPQPAEPAPAPVLPPLPTIDQTSVQAAPQSEQLLTGVRFDLIRSASINGMVATLSGLSATSVVLEIPNLEPGNYSLDLETSNGRISFQGLVEVVEASLGSAQVGATFSVITGLNPRSSWLNKTALAELEEIFKGQRAVTCIAYNDRQGLAARKKALSRASHACRIADQLGLETRVFVYGKAPELANTVKILFR